MEKEKKTLYINLNIFLIYFISNCGPSMTQMKRDESFKDEYVLISDTRENFVFVINSIFPHALHGLDL